VLIFLAIVGLVLAIGIVASSGPVDAAGIAIAIGGGFMTLGLTLKIIAQLIYIRAEI